MGEERNPSLLASYLHTDSAAPAIRFLSVAQNPNSNYDNNDLEDELELDESDIIWSSSSIQQTQTQSPKETDVDNYSSVAKSLVSSPSHTPENRGSFLTKNRSFRPAKFGLSAALEQDDTNTIVPSISAAKAVPQSFSKLDSSPSTVRFGSGRLYQMSAPVNVPIWGANGSRFTIEEGDWMVEKEVDVDVDGDKDVDLEEEEEEMVPPHIMVARSHVTTFSVFEGIGRTLKGRDLRRVRNAVLQKTGFLD
ncbi:hypothetical protein ZOSMA_77G00310 [Zostera marina]|uniref:Senescence regulator S40 n=1 Tax=Zostera marina TaxID=29655 RepID=A0A0K9NQL1_ZOSMR|nr:hypothetical protein ZOSMA_77G00310 [Zostera marina]